LIQLLYLPTTGMPKFEKSRYRCIPDTVSFSLQPFLVFQIALFGVYGLVRLAGRSGNWSQNEKSNIQHVSDVIATWVYATVPFVFGNYAHTFSEVTGVGMVLGALGFGYVTNMKAFRRSLQTVDSWPKEVVITGLALVVGIFALLVYLWKVCRQTPESREFFIAMVAVAIGFSFLVYSGYKQSSKSERERLHLHHFQIFWALSFLTRYNTNISRFFGGVFLGIFVEGISAYSPDPLLDVEPVPCALTN
jgi:uncharacterized membrane protein YiaA